MEFRRRHFLQFAAGVAAASVLPTAVSAETYPARPVRVIVPYAPGGPADILARLAAQKLTEQLGRPFYVENIGGAGGNLGMGQGARAPADGYTMLVVPPNIVVNPAMYATVPYDPYKDSTRSRLRSPRRACSRCIHRWRSKRSGTSSH